MTASVAARTRKRRAARDASDTSKFSQMTCVEIKR